MTVKTLANIFVPIIKPTLKKANFGPKIFVNPNDRRPNKTNMVVKNKKLFLIRLDLHKKSQMIQDRIKDKTEYEIAVNGDNSKTLLSTINTPEL